LLSADFGNLARDIEMLNNSDADWFHLDIMDGSFVPNFSFGFPVVKAIARHAKKPLDVHLMINEPDRYIQSFRDAGAYLITVHYEACIHLHRTLQFIRSTGALTGLALNPHTPVRLVEEIISETDLLLIMSVNPGFGGQKFIKHSLEKIVRAKKIITDKNLKTLIEVDGGVDIKNGRDIIDAGADVLVTGNSVFSTNDPAKAIFDLKAL
jgi:ribulose-phosphate 3-epimerase